MELLKKVIALLCTIVIILSTLFTIVYFNEFNTMLSVDKIEESKYFVDVEGDYYLDDLIKAGGADSTKNLSNFLSISITKGFPFLFNVDTTYNHVTSTVGVKDTTTIKTNNSENNNILIVKTTPYNRYASVSTVDLSYLNVEELSFTKNLLGMAATYFPMDGINETGLSASLVLNKKDGYTNPERTSAVDLTETVMLRVILDNASTVAEAKELIESYDLFSSGQNDFEFVITDSNGDCLNYKFISKGTHYVTEETSYKNEVNNLDELINETNLTYSVVYNNSDLTANYYFTKETTESNFTIKL